MSAKPNPPVIEIRDFNFLLGKWSVLNKRLKERLSDCTEWIEFTAEMETKSILNGLGLMDEMKSSHFGDEFIGLSIRMVDPKTNIWTIYWADTASPENYLKEQVVGGFKDGIGEFFGKEYYQGKEYKLRFRWKKHSPDTALWEQAYYDKRKNEWETNWTMEFTKRDK
ncbi:hypothetical protein GWK08_16525 [Leptobacterium flavescens]|uniref:DUF1579 domain-containing protein n=1 Tax=Leptobacterium flavescens TaxID=472055 RepID=A0A6P0UNV8_9FLAO|nr:hypothetical protein [Leptobacterium flavescens]NER15061.1 hypothetical protein [Leptobacterium flavescens]